MAVIFDERFEWPKTAPKANAQSEETIKAILKLLGGSRIPWIYFRVLDDIRYRAEEVHPGGVYHIVLHLPDNLIFVWPKGKRLGSDPKVIKFALKLVDKSYFDQSDYFISDHQGGRSLQFESDGYVYPGIAYYLRPV
jgi:hypothetical protein